MYNLDATEIGGICFTSTALSPGVRSSVRRRTWLMGGNTIGLTHDSGPHTVATTSISRRASS
jgi:hypothetical protein